MNGVNIGRYWSVGPQKSLYIPAPLLRKGPNTVSTDQQLHNYFLMLFIIGYDI